MTVRGAERGSATAEAAVALPALVLVLAAALSALDLGVSQVRCVDAATTAARLLARGEDPLNARQRALAGTPPGARMQVERQGDSVRVTVTAPRPRGLGGWDLVPEPGAVAEAVLEGEAS